MTRRRKREEWQRYLPGATWRDVLRGRPVTLAEQERERRPGRKPTRYRCRDCSFVGAVQAPCTRPRCERCGGILDPTCGW
jgi:hypothetical protein